MAHMPGSLPPVWETQIESLALGFSLTQPGCRGHLRGENQCLSLQ